MSDAAAVPPSAPGAGAARWSGRVAPYADHGPLPLLLLALTAVTGVVDAVSYIAFGHVFVANMTGNVVLLATALGGQNAVARGIAVPDLTTTVLTLTLTAIVAEARIAGGPGEAPLRRGGAVLAMFAGALAGGLLTVHASPAAALGLATATAAGLALAAHRLARSAAPWAAR